MYSSAVSSVTDAYLIHVRLHDSDTTDVEAISALSVLFEMDLGVNMIVRETLI